MCELSKELEKKRDAMNEEWLVNIRGERAHLYEDRIDAELNIRYAEGWGPYHLLDVYSPKDAGDRVLPLVIVIHGGGYVFCRKETNLMQARYFATRGYRVINMDYRLFPDVDCRGIEQDVFAVFRWAAENAAKYHFDLNHVGITGDSAGGHCILLTALLLNNADLREKYGVELPPYPITHCAACCPGINASIDPETGCMWGGKEEAGFTREQLDSLAGFETFDITELCRKYELPDVFIFCTPTDDLCYRDDAAFEEFLNKKGVKHHFRAYSGRSHVLSHVFNVTWPEWEESIEANEDVLKYFGDMLD